MVVSIVRFTIRIVRYETIQQLHDTNRLMNRFCSCIVFVSYDSDFESHESFRIDPNRSIHRDRCSSQWHLSRLRFLLQHLLQWRRRPFSRWCLLRWPLSWQPLSRWLLLPWCLSLPRKGWERSQQTLTAATRMASLYLTVAYPQR